MVPDVNYNIYVEKRRSLCFHYRFQNDVTPMHDVIFPCMYVQLFLLDSDSKCSEKKIKIYDKKKQYFDTIVCEKNISRII